MKIAALRCGILAVTILVLFLAARSSSEFAGAGTSKFSAASVSVRPARATAESWNPKTAAAYLDQRERWWMGWENAAREHGTFCISCHTAAPYALARPALRKALSEQAPTEIERVLIENAAKRVRLWKDLAPLYGDKEYGPHKGVESRGTESVLLALVLASNDAQTGKLSADTRTAFNNLWALQQTTGTNQGAWLWQLFDLNPWEGNISPYYGATIAAIAVGTAPENYRDAPEIQANLKLLREYLDREYSSQPLVNRLTLLWASAKLPGVLTPERKKSIIDDVLSRQQADGGWSLFPLARTWKDWSPSTLAGKWKRADGSLQETRSDGYATGLAVYVLQQSSVPRENSQIQRGREWLIRNQDQTEGFWLAYSLNKRRDPASNVGRFMSDAATAYSVLALTE
jgi:squalene-hopene/tetraprenyl-beta-curcumene cyclase